MTNVYAPMQPDQYQAYGQTNVSPTHPRQAHTMVSSHHGVVPPASAVAPGFYGASVVSQGGTGNLRNPFTASASTLVGTDSNNTAHEERTDRMNAWLQ